MHCVHRAHAVQPNTFVTECCALPRKLIGESEELRDLQELDRELCVWREKVESTIDSRQADRIAVRQDTTSLFVALCRPLPKILFVQVLEKLEEQASEIEVDFTNSELMKRLAEALKTYCICGGKDDDTFMIQCDDCEDWFHGRCVNVEVRPSRGPPEHNICREPCVLCCVCLSGHRSSKELSASKRQWRKWCLCARGVVKSGPSRTGFILTTTRLKVRGFMPITPHHLLQVENVLSRCCTCTDTDAVDQHRKARQQRTRLLKERRVHMAEAAENKCKKRVRSKPAPTESSKKPKLDMHDAELFVDRIKVSDACARAPLQPMPCL